MKCRINLRGKQVLSPNYQESVLFNQLLSLTQDFQEALDFYAVSETNEFKEIYGSKEPSLRNLMIYINSFETSPVSKTEVIEVMQASNFTNSNELLKALEKSEKEGILIFTRNSLQKSGIFSTFASENALERQVSVQNLVNYLRQNEDIEIQEREYEIGDSLNIVGQVSQVNTGTEVVFEGQVSDINALDTGYNQGLSENISFIRNGVRDSSWETMGNQVTAILSEIEYQAVENGVNLKGLSDSYMNKTKAEVLNILDVVEQALSEEISEQELQVALNDYFQREPVKRYMDLKPSEVLLKTDFTEEEAYTQMGLIKLTDAVYRRVINNTGIVYNSVREEIEDLKDRLNISTYIPAMNASKIENFYGDYDYLSEDFIKDFGKYLIETENNYFVVDEEGISLRDERDIEKALDSLHEDVLEDLEQYSLISKKLNLPYEVEMIPEYELNEFQLERDKVVANPHIINEFKGDFSYIQDGIAVNNVEDQFLRVGETVYEIVENEGNTSYYMELPKQFALDIEKPTMTSERIPMSNSAQPIRIEKTNNSNYKC